MFYTISNKGVINMAKKLKREYARKRLEDNKIISDFLLSNGVAHIACVVKNKDELINHFSPKGYELLSDEFASYLDQVSLNLPDHVPVLIEIIGCEFEKDDEDAVRNAIWNRYELLASYKQRQKKNSIFRIIWFALFLIITCILVLALKDTSQNQVYLNLLFVAFYFFGDYLIRTPLLENRPINKERIKYIQMSRSRVYFSGKKPLSHLSDEQVKRITDTVLSNIHYAEDEK